MEVEGVVAHTPCHCTFLASCRGLVGLTLYACTIRRCFWSSFLFRNRIVLEKVTYTSPWCGSDKWHSCPLQCLCNRKTNLINLIYAINVKIINLTPCPEGNCIPLLVSQSVWWSMNVCACVRVYTVEDSCLYALCGWYHQPHGVHVVAHLLDFKSLLIPNCWSWVYFHSFSHLQKPICTVTMAF